MENQREKKETLRSLSLDCYSRMSWSKLGCLDVNFEREKETTIIIMLYCRKNSDHEIWRHLRDKQAKNLVRYFDDKVKNLYLFILIIK